MNSLFSEFFQEGGMWGVFGSRLGGIWIFDRRLGGIWKFFGGKSYDYLIYKNLTNF